MRKYVLHLTVATAISALSVACSGRTTAVNMTEERAKSATNENPNQRLELIGCVKPSPIVAEGKFVLDKIVLPPGALQPQKTTSAGAVPLIPSGSWVLLAGQDMQPYLGKQVVISGDLVNRAQKPVGTTGVKAAVPGDFPEIAVETVKIQSDKCE